MFCRNCAEKEFSKWKGWPERDKCPDIPLLVNDRCPNCEGCDALDPSHIVYINVHGAFSTGLPDYFILGICEPKNDNYKFYRKWGVPYNQ